MFDILKQITIRRSVSGRLFALGRARHLRCGTWNGALSFGNFTSCEVCVLNQIIRMQFFRIILLPPFWRFAVLACRWDPDRVHRRSSWNGCLSKLVRVDFQISLERVSIIFNSTKFHAFVKQNTDCLRGSSKAESGIMFSPFLWNNALSASVAKTLCGITIQ